MTCHLHYIIFVVFMYFSIQNSVIFNQEETLYMDRDSQIKAIEKTFEDNKKPIERHYSKPNVVPVEILPVYPDFKVLLQRLL